MRKFGRVPRPGSLQAFRVIVGVLVATVTWGFLTQRSNSLVAVRGVCAEDKSSICLLSRAEGCSGGQGDSRTAWPFCLFQQDCD